MSDQAQLRSGGIPDRLIRPMSIDFPAVGVTDPVATVSVQLDVTLVDGTKQTLVIADLQRGTTTIDLTSVTVTSSPV